ncbi:MAG: thermonuclease family protein [Lewinellaceae bacterium]|nr:thermonuclease family protein [Lewinellaceae bacterium]MCB9334301.1 thermonuclease family protein [Lewinellaceae bacterium]
MPVLTALRIFILAALFLIPAACSEDQPLSKRSGRVVCKCIGVYDGDTITVLTRSKKQFKVRLAHIDCPEKGQPFGKAARQFTADFCFGKMVRIQQTAKKDRNGRIIGLVFNEQGKNLNQALVRAGLAWHFKKYSNDPIYSQLETTARNEKIGLWQEFDPIPPWQWRKKK